MTIAESLLPEFDQEMASTRKIIERVPDGQGSWRPHKKSMELGYLAVHLSTLPNFIKSIVTQDELDVAAAASGEWKMPAFTSAAESVAVFDKSVDNARSILAKASDSELLKNWTLRNKGAVMFSVPRIAAIRTMVFNHLVHHRGQMTVYLRLNDVPLPSLYGPTADEPM